MVKELRIFGIESYIEEKLYQTRDEMNQELWDFMCHKAKVATDDGPKFGPNGEAGGFQRINFSCPRAQLEEALNRIAEALDAL